tara:strand:- start:2846 stop:3643 length:798 start_codon:yes stop_codon:yes gene_type:complete
MSVYAKERPNYLAEALESLVHQTRPPDEIVLVEDGPITDSLTEVIDGFRDMLPICSVPLARNMGLGAALTSGLMAATGDLVARLDTDDHAMPERFARQLAAFASQPELDIVGSYATEMDAEGVLGKVRAMPLDHEQIYRTLWANPIIHPSVMFRREPIISIGGYSAEALRCEDYELWIRAAETGLKFANIAEPLIEYRFTPETLRRQSRKNLWQQGIIGMCGSRRLGLPVWKQLACFVPFARSLLPIAFQHRVYRLLEHVDPRRS